MITIQPCKATPHNSNESMEFVNKNPKWSWSQKFHISPQLKHDERKKVFIRIKERGEMIESKEGRCIDNINR